jgi:hypothetical protein
VRRIGAVAAPWIIAGAVLLAVLVNLAIYGIGRVLGASFAFTTPAGPAAVDPVTLIGFTAVPLTIGLAALALIGRWWMGAYVVALVVAPVLEVGSILIMTVPTDLDPISKATLAACHLALVPVTIVAVKALRRRRTAGASRQAPDPAARSRQVASAPAAR